MGSRMMQALAAFAEWLGGTPLTALVAGHFWIVPALQTIHILAVAAVLVSTLLINLRVLGLIEGTQPVLAVLDRYLRPTGIGVLVLAVTGFLLIAGEPTRAIFRTIFWVKMLLIVVAFTLTASHRSAFVVAGADGVATTLRKAVAVAALLAWLAVIVAGRWIAYVEAWPGAPE